MLEKIQAFVRRFNPHSKVFIVAVFSVFFLILILLTLQFRVGQSGQNNTSQNTVSPTPHTLTPGRDYVEGQINAKFADGMTDQKINQILTPYNARIKSTITGINVKVVEVPVGREEEITKKLTEEGIVKYAELNFTGRAVIDPNDTHFGLQYGLKNTGQDIKGKKGTINSDVHAEGAWNVTKGDGVKVAVVDSGIDPNHPDFAGKIVAQKSFTSALSVDDGFGHGTHVAGTVTANTNNGQGVAGTCPNCQLIIAKSLNDSGSGDVAGVSNGVTWAADNGAKVMNISIVMNNGLAPEPLKDAIAYAWSKGIVIIAAAGNCGGSNYASNGCTVMNQVLYPAAFPNVVSVANIDNKDLMNPTSNHGTWVDVAAYGTDIVSTLPTKQNFFGVLNYGYLTGTSMASPMVAGVAGLVWGSQYGTSNQAVVDRLLNTADPISGTGTNWTKGRVNAAAAVGASNVTPPITPGITASPSATVAPTVPPPTSGVTPTTPVPTFVCGGSPNSVCNSPTPTRGPNPTTPPNPTITQGPALTGTPTITSPVTPVPDNDCLDPRSTPERIREWVNGFIKKIQDYIQRVLGNPTDPSRPLPPQPCIIR